MIRGRMAAAANPFHYGALALDEAFTDRAAELAELERDMLNGQDVVIFAPRRYGKSSLVWRVQQKVIAKRVLVAHVDLMTTPTKEKLAEKLAEAIHEDVASALYRARERALSVFRGLRITPSILIDPNTGAVTFAFEPGLRREDVDATLERLLTLPGELGGERKRKVALVFDEFQEIVEIDPNLPKLMRAVFQRQPEVSHVYLGSKRHMMQQIFNDENEPFWRSAKQLELSVIAPADFRDFIGERFRSTGKRIADEAVAAILELTGGHPYATQELCYFVWEATPARRAAAASLAQGPSRLPRAPRLLDPRDPLSEERLRDRVRAVRTLRDQLVSDERGQRPLDVRLRREAVAAPVLLAVRMAGLSCERGEQHALHRRGAVPNEREVRVL